AGAAAVASSAGGGIDFGTLRARLSRSHFPVAHSGGLSGLRAPSTDALETLMVSKVQHSLCVARSQSHSASGWFGGFYGFVDIRFWDLVVFSATAGRHCIRACRAVRQAPGRRRSEA